MNKHFEPIFNALQEQKENLLGQVKSISPDTFNYKPAPGKWSINQILMHLITSEKLSIGYMKKKSLGVDQLRNSGIMEKIRIGFFIISQRLPLKYKAPRVVVDKTPQAGSLTELIQQWDAVRSELADFLERIEDKNVYKVIYKHPFAGRLDVAQTMIFFREHIIHHSPQIFRILDTPDK